MPYVSVPLRLGRLAPYYTVLRPLDAPADQYLSASAPDLCNNLAASILIALAQVPVIGVHSL